MDYFNSAELFRYLLLLLGVLLTMLSLQIISQALFPDFVRRSQGMYDRPWKTSLVGLIGWAVVIICVAIFTKIPVLNIPGALLLFAAFVLALAGSAGLARRIGSGLQCPVDKEQPWRRTWRGALLLMGTNLLLLGVIPMLLSGMGAAIRTLRQISKDKATADDGLEADSER